MDTDMNDDLYSQLARGARARNVNAIWSAAIGMAKMALMQNDPEKAMSVLNKACNDADAIFDAKPEQAPAAPITDRQAWIDDKPAAPSMDVEAQTEMLWRIIQRLALIPADDFYKSGDYAAGLVNEAWREARDLMSNKAARRQQAPDGWVMVPREPTEAMLNTLGVGSSSPGVYRNLLAAAPQQPAPKSEGDIARALDWVRNEMEYPPRMLGIVGIIEEAIAARVTVQAAPGVVAWRADPIMAGYAINGYRIVRGEEEPIARTIVKDEGYDEEAATLIVDALNAYTKEFKI